MQEIDRLVQRERSSSEFVDAYLAWFEPHPADGFAAFERRTFPLVHVIRSDRVADLYATSSDIASLPPDVRSNLLARIAEVAARLPATLELAQRSEVYLSFRA